MPDYKGIVEVKRKRTRSRIELIYRSMKKSELVRKALSYRSDYPTAGYGTQTEIKPGKKANSPYYYLRITRMTSCA